MVPLSVLDLSPILQGSDAAQALRNTLDLAQHAERWGYKRYWLAEHHNIPSVASAATSVVIGAVAAATRSIRVGAGGIMLPNHAPLVIAEQFGTLESLFAGRIDLALGRAPGSDQPTARALRRNLASEVDAFPEDVLELMMYFRAPAGQPVKAIPGAGLNVPIWILGSSLYGAQLAAELGLPYGFASHFAPALMIPAIDLYRSRFRPSEQLARPHVMLGVNVVSADTDEEARRLFTSHQQAFVNLRHGTPGPLPPPDEAFLDRLPADQKREVDQTLSVRAVGSAGTVRRALEELAAGTGADELIVVAQIFDHRARLRSYEITAALG
ncbi:MAG TPA: LLM class flavin-dependent oxidoreductase [Vicinamibacterales bacterium]|jgi:luciferase family oxidoreductase group 1|nr:LLM class flavin-dependent oxidoreductase [Vicinamibacterales bacterium]